MTGTTRSGSRGPLAGFKVIELAGIGPGPMCAMVLADLGATVLRVDRTASVEQGIQRPLRFNLLLRNRHAISLDLKSAEGVKAVLKLIDSADALIEGFRPGVMERLGLGPDVCLKRNPRLVYGRMTGWGQDGPLAHRAGHDINYLAITGLLDAMGRAGQPPTIPLNVVGDYAGGALYLAIGILAGVCEASRSGTGQVIDAAIVDGASHLSTGFFGLLAAGMLGQRGTNILDGAAPFYDVFECSDGNWISIGPIESRFYAELLRLIGLDPGVLGKQSDRSAWAADHDRIAAVFRTRTREAWTERLQESDACFAPVLNWTEAPGHPHLAHRSTFVTVDDVVQPAPAPRFSRTPTSIPVAPAPVDANVDHALEGWLSAGDVAALRAAGAIR